MIRRPGAGEFLRFRVCLPAFVAALTCAVPDAGAYGPEGHLIAGRAAEPRLCERARRDVQRLGDSEDLGELGLWADRIRSDPAWEASGPWHYMNIADDVGIDAFDHPEEGDVLWAIGHFSARLGDRGLSDTARREALGFLVHFIVDVHQPLHVGRAADRGGNSIDLRFRGRATNLHRFWDTHAIEWRDRSIADYVAAIVDTERSDAAVDLDPAVWAAESLALRERVYAFGREGREPRRSYQAFAARVTEERLRLAALRLAATLNAILCERR